MDVEAVGHCRIHVLSRSTLDHMRDAYPKETLSLITSIKSDVELKKRLSIEEIAALRRFYPELKEVHAYAALQSFSDYHSVELGIRSTGVYEREQEFLFYLIGKATASAEVKYSIAAHGERVAYFLIKGEKMPIAIEKASRCTAYDRELSRLCSNLAKACLFLKEDAQSTAQKGSPVSTIGDLFREGRKYNVKPYVYDSATGERLKNA